MISSRQSSREIGSFTGKKQSTAWIENFAYRFHKPIEIFESEN